MALNDSAWEVAVRRGAGKDAYARALRRAEAAVRLVPDFWNFQNTLGVAQYRVGQYAKTLETLEQSGVKPPLQFGGKQGDPYPEDLAFIAMAHHQLGHKEQARATLARMREVMKQPRWAQDAESQACLREAEELIEGQPADQKK
jgi:hypothetical protein